MLMLRIAGFIVLLAIIGCMGFFVATRDRRYLRLCGQIVRYTIFAAAVFMAFYVFERVILAI